MCSARGMDAWQPSRSPIRAYALACSAFRSVISAGDRAAAGAAQRGLGVLDDLPVTAPVQGLVREQGDDVAAESAVAGGLGHAQCLEEVPLRDSLQVGVVGADPGQRRQPAGGPVQFPARRVVVGALDDRRGALSQELHDPGAHGHAAGLPVHALIPECAPPAAPAPDPG